MTGAVESSGLKWGWEGKACSAFSLADPLPVTSETDAEPIADTCCELDLLAALPECATWHDGRVVKTTRFGQWFKDARGPQLLTRVVCYHQLLFALVCRC